MKTILSHVFKKAMEHKFIAGFFVILFIGGGYYGIQKIGGTSTETRYVLAAVQKGTVIATITGSGQVSASNQVDIKPKVSGDIVFVGAKTGGDVKAGTLIAQIDARDAQKAVRDAEVNLESAQLSLDKLKQPADTLSLIQAEHTLARAEESKQNATNDLSSAYESGFNTIANAFLDLPTVMTGLQNILYSSNAALGGSNIENIDYYGTAVQNIDATALQYRDDTQTKYQQARSAYDRNFADYKALDRSSDSAVIESVITETYNTAKDIAEAVKSASNLIQFYKDKLAERNITPSAVADTHLANLNTYTGKTNTDLVNLLSAGNTIANDKDTIVNAGRTIAENTGSLAKLKAGADPLDIQSTELSLKQRQNALLDAREKLTDYFIRAPFDGTVAKVNIKKSDSIASGAAIATLITKQKLATISLNEVDVTKVKQNQKVTLTFDAIENLSITGEVADIDTIGTVSQGVVTYNVTIGFDTQDDRVKPGMSASAAIITGVRQDVLTVPNSAVKSQGGNSYIQVVAANALPANGQSQTVPQQGTALPVAPEQRQVTTGISNDTSTEIISGLKEGDEIVTRTVTTAVKAATTQAPSLFGNTGTGVRGVGGGGGGVRTIRND